MVEAIGRAPTVTQRKRYLVPRFKERFRYPRFELFTTEGLRNFVKTQAVLTLHQNEDQLIVLPNANPYSSLPHFMVIPIPRIKKNKIVDIFPMAPYLIRPEVLEAIATTTQSLFNIQRNHYPSSEVETICGYNQAPQNLIFGSLKGLRSVVEQGDKKTHGQSKELFHLQVFSLPRNAHQFSLDSSRHIPNPVVDGSGLNESWAKGISSLINYMPGLTSLETNERGLALSFNQDLFTDPLSLSQRLGTFSLTSERYNRTLSAELKPKLVPYYRYIDALLELKLHELIPNISTDTPIPPFCYSPQMPICLSNEREVASQLKHFVRENGFSTKSHIGSSIFISGDSPNILRSIPLFVLGQSAGVFEAATKAEMIRDEIVTERGEDRRNFFRDLVSIIEQLANTLSGTFRYEFGEALDDLRLQAAV